MELALVVATCRARAGWSLRRLGERAATSHATLSAYEHGRLSPTIETLSRIVEASRHRMEVRLEPLVAPPLERGRELEAVLELAEQFPARHERRPLPVFGVAGWGRPAVVT